MKERSQAPLTLLALLAGILFLALQGGRPLVPPSPDIVVTAQAVATGGNLSPAALHDVLTPRGGSSQPFAGPSDPPAPLTLHATAAAAPEAAPRCTFGQPAAWPARSHAPCARPQTGPPAA
ncbi:hypothetical protein [Chelatococcus sp. XZ-Ab1]|uniref:hypothetical protein n=1 Tax=Chelatococcus sp. XZ-Ab1 TaxID=3034027 RepID=UPI0023E3D075|nr:hypothetical protein [Chelatococcus sp. XZ-Ab1]